MLIILSKNILARNKCGILHASPITVSELAHEEK
jgi:hypothetical protein